MTPIRLYLRCLRWGLTAGAVAGAGTLAYAGFLGHLSDLRDASIGVRMEQAFSGALQGAPFGMMVAVVPTLIGGLVVLSIVWGSHPRPASTDAVRRDVGVASYGLTAILAGAVLFAALLEGGASDAGEILPWVLVPTACLLVVLWPAVTSIARGWAGDRQTSAVLSGRPKGSW